MRPNRRYPASGTPASQHMVEHSVTILLPHPYIASTAVFERDIIVVIGLEFPLVELFILFHILIGLDGIGS